MTKQKLPISPAQVDESAAPPSDTSPDKLMPDPAVCAEFGVTAMTLWRLERPPCTIRKSDCLLDK